jgi:nucleoside-diphosphate-sugar epimerase
MQRRVPDVSKIEQYVGWRPEWSLDEILADMLSGAMAADPPPSSGHSGFAAAQSRD